MHDGKIEKVKIDLSKAIKNNDIKAITGSADFFDSQITDLPSLKIIGGKADFRNLQVTNIDSLKFV